MNCAYHGVVAPQSSKKSVAAEVWQLMLDTAMRQFGRSSAILQEYGLTPGHLKLLLQIDEAEGRPMGSLAQTVQCDASTMTWLVDRLEEKGFVERRMLPTDRRVKAVVLTPLGIKTKAKIKEHLYRPPAELMELDREALDYLQETLTKVRGSMPQEPAPPVRIRETA